MWRTIVVFVVICMQACLANWTEVVASGYGRRFCCYTADSSNWGIIAVTIAVGAVMRRCAAQGRTESITTRRLSIRGWRPIARSEFRNGDARRFKLRLFFHRVETLRVSMSGIDRPGTRCPCTCRFGFSAPPVSTYCGLP